MYYYSVILSVSCLTFVNINDICNNFNVHNTIQKEIIWINHYIRIKNI